MKLRYVVLIALAAAIGPVGWALLARQLFALAYSSGVPFEIASLASLVFATFPFFFWATWVLTNMDSWERVLKKITG